MIAPRAVARRAFTLVEILVAVAILGIIGAGLVRLILSQTRFTEKQMASRNARTVSRNAMNIMLTDLRMVQDSGGLVAASRDSVVVRVPLVFGLLCTTGSNPMMSMLPVDSAMTALAYYAGFAVRDSVTERYNYKDTGDPRPYAQLTTPLLTTPCTDVTTGAGISVITFKNRTGRYISLNSSPAGSAAPGWPVFLYQIIKYRFGPSTAFPGRVGLFRDIKTDDDAWKRDEIIAPFDTSAKIRFYVLNEDTAQSAVPAELKTVRGLQLVLAGSSPGTPRQSTAPAQAALVTGVFFKNRRDP